MAKKKLEVKDLKITFKTDHGLVKAVRNISFDLYEGETLCIVGESGSGKSVTSKAIMQILANNAIIESGSIMYEGENLLEVSEEEFYKIRGHKIGMIFQDPLSSLNPIVRIGKQITEATLINSNKLKLMYDELISDELVAYKNEIAHAQIKIKKATSQYELFEEECFKKVETATPEEATKIKQELKERKSKLKAEVKEIKNNLKSTLPSFKEKLKVSKAEAKIKVSEYKKTIKQEYVDKNIQTKAKLQEKLVELNTNGGSATEIAQAKKDATATLKLNKKEYIDKTKITKAEAKRRAIEIMREVGIPMPEKRFRQYPFEFSGGMRQRIVIAIALTAAPDILICDEPTTALDVTIQAQILELINKLKEEKNLSIIFITHDLGVVANMADDIAVMYAGKIVEYGSVYDVFYDPRHPYTWALLSSMPDLNTSEKLDAIPGTPPNMLLPPKGDAFAARNKYALEIDYEEQPPFYQVSPTHYVASWLVDEYAPDVEAPQIVRERIYNSLKNNKENKPTYIISKNSILNGMGGKK